MQKRIENRLQELKKALPNNTLYWGVNDFTVFLFGVVLFFGCSIVIMFFSYSPYLRMCVTDWWILPLGLGFVFLFLFIICKKVDGDEEE